MRVIADETVADLAQRRVLLLPEVQLLGLRLLRQKLLQLWPDLRGMDVLGLGYATPLLRPYLSQSCNMMAFMPAQQGVVYWPREGPNRTLLADPLELPLPDNSIDRVVLLHAVEGAADIGTLLRETWRVLKSGGRMIAVNSEKHLLEAFDQISEELRSQYTLGYYPTNAAQDGKFRKLKVEATDKDLKVLTRRGYYAPKG